MRILALALFAIVLTISTATADTLKFTATPVTGKLVNFRTVDESKVPGRLEVQTVLSRPTGRAGSTSLSIPVAFEAQREPYKSGVERPDMALGVGPRFIVQSINAGVSVYTTSGQLVQGWPKSANAFLGQKDTDFAGDTRAAWDTWDHRYWVTYLCQRGLCIAVSKTSDPNGIWYVYGFELADKPGFEIDFDQFGFDQHTISVSTHLGHYFHGPLGLHANIFTIDKAALESGSKNVVPQGYADLHVAGHDLDTVEPVLVPDPSGASPAGEFFMSTEGFNFPCYVFRPYCKSVYLFMLAGGGNSQTISGASIVTSPYRFTPLADTTACKLCLETVGPMMTTSPVYDNGRISFAFGTGVNNGTQEISAIRWGQLTPILTGTQLTNAQPIQSGTLAYPGDLAAFFPSVMTDFSGNFYMIFDESSSTLNPSVFVAGRRSTDPLGQLTSTVLVKRGLKPPTVPFWGDYTAGAFGGSRRSAWFASEYAGVGNIYGTEIFEVKF